jgi:hypothetical protein
LNSFLTNNLMATVNKAIKITPAQLIDEMMDLELPSHLQTNIYQMAKSVESMAAQNKLLLMTSIALMAEFDKASADAVLNGMAKVAISKEVIDKVAKRAELNKEKPVLCYSEKDGEGFVRLKWVPVNQSASEVVEDAD